MKFLIICPLTPGDLVFATPVIRILKAQAEEAEVDLCITKQAYQAAAENPYLDKIYFIDENFWHVALALKNKNYHYIIDLRHDGVSIGLTLFSPSKIFRVKKNFLKNWLMTYLKIDKLSNQHLTDRYLNTISPLALKPDTLGLDFFIPEKDHVPVAWLPETHRQEFVAVMLDAAYNTRRLPALRLIELCDKINKPIILLGAESHEKEGKTVEEFFTPRSNAWEEGLKDLNKKAIVYNACSKFSFHQMASVIRQAKYIFTYDNDFVPIASALRKHIFIIFGNSILRFGRYPYQTHFTVLENNKISCRPCSTKGYAHCPRGHFKCMKDIIFDFYLS